MHIHNYTRKTHLWYIEMKYPRIQLTFAVGSVIAPVKFTAGRLRSREKYKIVMPGSSGKSPYAGRK